MVEIALQDYIQQIEDLIEQGRYDEVLAHGRHILQHYPKYLATYSVMGKAMLEAAQDRFAEDMFKRVLSGDPENYLARVGMSIVYDRQGDLEKAHWHMEQAFELAPDNGAIRSELRRLYGRRDGVEPGRLDLTRGALARLYARGALYPRAIEELRTLLKEDPQRIDLRIALAEVLWRNEQRVQAEEVCLQVLDELPYCLKANLILGEIYTRTGRAEGRECLQHAEALDPESRVAVELLGDASPLPSRVVRVTLLEYTLPEERPEWMPVVKVPAAIEEEGALVDLSAALETQIEIPAWLEEVALGGAASVAAEEEVGEEEGLGVPAWLVEQPAVEAEAAPISFEEVAGPVVEGPPAAAEIPEWLAEVAPGAEPEEEAVPVVELPPVPAEIPEWLADMAPAEVKEEAALPPEEPSPEVPSWLEEEGLPSGDEAVAWLESLMAGKEDELRAAAEAEAEARVAEITGRAPEKVEPTPPVEPAAVPKVEEPVLEVPEWLAETAPVVEEAPQEVPPPVPEEEALPPWLEEEGLPSGDEALAWLESLVAGKEELRAAAEAEGEARFAEITGRAPERAVPAPPVEPAPALEVEEPVPEVPEWLAEAVQLEEPALPEEPPTAAPAAEPEAFGWTALGEDVAPGEPLEVAPEAPPPEEGFGWTAFEAEVAPPAEEVVAPELGPPPTPPLVEVVPEEAPLPPPVEEVPGPVEVETVADLEKLESLREHVRSHRRDHQVRLTLARELWRAGIYDESLDAYSRLLHSNRLVDDVLEDVEVYKVERPSDPVVRRTLGDAYMRVGRLEEALEIYREALESL